MKDTTDVLIRRICALEAGLDVRRIQNGSLTDAEWSKLQTAIEFLSATRLTFYNGSIAGRTISDIYDKVMEGQYDLIIIDDLNSIDDFDSSYDADKTARTLKQIKYLSQDAQIPIISLYCLRTKDISKRQDKRPTVMDLDYSSLQNYSDNIQFLYLYKDEYEAIPALDIIIAKNTLGQQGTVRLAIANGGIYSIEN